MNLNSIDWADSDLVRIIIEYDHALIIVWNDTLQKRVKIHCYGLAGITNLCIWDDTTIMHASVCPVENVNNSFLNSLYSSYDKDFDYGGRYLNSGLLEVKIELSNHITCSIYCLKVDIAYDIQ